MVSVNRKHTNFYSATVSKVQGTIQFASAASSQKRCQR